MTSLYHYKKGILFLLLLFTTQLYADNGSKTSIEVFPNNAPWSFVNSHNQPDGFVVELTEAIMQALNDSCNFHFTNPELDILQSDMPDTTAVYVVTKSDELTDRFYFSAPLATQFYDVIVRNGQRYNNIRDIIGRRIIVKENGASHALLRNLGPAFSEKLILVNNMEIGLKMLSGGEGDVALCDHANANAIIAAEGLNNLIAYESGLPFQDLCYASQDESIITAINQAFSSLKRQGDYDRLYYKWYVADASDNSSTKFVVGWILLILLAGIAIGLVWWYKQRKINALTDRLDECEERKNNLKQIINVLTADANEEIFVYEIFKDELYALVDNELVKSPFKLKEIETFIHVDDKEQYANCLEDVMDGVRNDVVIPLHIYDLDLGKYCDYEYKWCGQKNANGSVVAIVYSRYLVSSQTPVELEEEDEVEEICDDIEAVFMAGMPTTEESSFDVVDEYAKVLENTNVEIAEEEIVEEEKEEIVDHIDEEVVDNEEEPLESTMDLEPESLIDKEEDKEVDKEVDEEVVKEEDKETESSIKEEAKEITSPTENINEEDKDAMSDISTPESFDEEEITNLPITEQKTSTAEDETNAALSIEEEKQEEQVEFVETIEEPIAVEDEQPIVEKSSEDVLSSTILFDTDGEPNIELEEALQTEDDSINTPVEEMQPADETLKQMVDTNTIVFDIEETLKEEEPVEELLMVEEPASEYKMIDRVEEESSEAKINILEEKIVEPEEVIVEIAPKKKSKSKAAKRREEPQQLGFLFDDMD